MASHFLLTAKARTLSLATVLRMTDAQAEKTFAGVRWPETDGKAVCPNCGCLTCYECRRPNGALRFRCKACRKDFSLTSGTLFAFHKLPLQTYLAATAIFCTEVKGKSALALSRDLDVQYKTAWVLAHKLREAMSTEVKGYKLGGVGKTVEVDGAYFGGYVKPANHKENRRDRRLVLPSAFKTEGSALAYIRNHVAAGTEVHADDANSWNDLHGHYVVKRINHQLSYSNGIACTNGAESFFSRLRRAKAGHHHHIAGAYLARYAQESAYREGHRRVDNGGQVRGVVGLALKARPSVDFCGYWQRAN
jgi:transposase-like protein